MADVEEPEQTRPEDGQRGLMTLRRRGIYLLPNLFTTAALFSGFYAIVQAMNDRFEHAAVAIFVAMLLDGLDGRVARLTHTQSELGAQYDSLSDMVAFGVAPAVVMYEWALKDLGKAGWIAAFVYCAGAALRLARFNVNVDVVDRRYFQGIPSPAAAALLAGLVWAFDDLGIDRELWLDLTAWVFTMYAGITMVTNVPFYSFKEFNLRKAVPFWVMLLLVGGLAVVSLRPAVVVFFGCLAFSVSGYVLWGMGVRVRRSPAVPE
jgi:CDP-diacylglycerol--serine O-phosphatidyltransferase